MWLSCTTKTLPSRGQRGCSNNLERVTRQKRHNGKRQNRLNRGVGHCGKPQCATSQNHQVAGSGTQRGRGKTAVGPSKWAMPPENTRPGAKTGSPSAPSVK